MLRLSIVALALLLVAVPSGCSSLPEAQGNDQNWFGQNPDFRTPRPGPHGKFPGDRKDRDMTDRF